MTFLQFLDIALANTDLNASKDLFGSLEMHATIVVSNFPSPHPSQITMLDRSKNDHFFSQHCNLGGGGGGEGKTNIVIWGARGIWEKRLNFA